MTLKKQVNLPCQTRSGNDDAHLVLRSDSVDLDERTAEIIWTTGARVKRNGYLPDGSGYGAYIEELSVEPDAIDLSRLEAGAPLLKNHWAYDLNDQLGVVVEGSIRVENGRGTALVKFSKRIDVEPHFQDVLDNVLRKISVGYSVQSYEVTREEGALPVFRATRWTPMELSFVLIPADNAAQVRNVADLQTTPCSIIDEDIMGSKTIAKEVDAEPGTDAGVQTRTVQTTPETLVVETIKVDANDNAAIEQRGIELERNRIVDIQRSVRSAGLDETVADDFIKRGTSLADANADIIEKMADADDKIEIRTTRAQIGDSNDDPTVKRTRMAQALAANHSDSKCPDDAKQYRNMTLLDLAVDYCDIRNVGYSSGAKIEVMKRAFGAMSDFPMILQEVGNRILLANYKVHEGTFKQIGQKQNMRDFRETSLINFGDMPDLEALGENGEYKEFTLQESKETLKLSTFGRQFSLTRHMVINDDLGAFVGFIAQMAQRAAIFENKLFWLRMFNAKMADNKTLFHADHKNLASPASALSVGTYDAGRKAMRTQKNRNDESIGIGPKFLVHGSATELTVEQFLAPVSAIKNDSDIVPAAMKKIQPLYEPQMDVHHANGWALFADPSAMATMAYSYLEGEEGPQTFIHENWSGDHMSFRVRDDFEAAPIDHRGAHLNKGA